MDPIVGTDQSLETFWVSVAVRFRQLLPADVPDRARRAKRSDSAIGKQFKYTVVPEVCKFRASVLAVQHMQLTGNPTEAQLLAAAVAHWRGTDPYDGIRAEGTAPLQCEWLRCWEVLKQSDKYSGAAAVGARRRRSGGAPAAAAADDEVVNLSDGDGEEEGGRVNAAALPFQARPLGSKAAKAARRADIAVALESKANTAALVALTQTMKEKANVTFWSSPAVVGTPEAARWRAAEMAVRLKEAEAAASAATAAASTRPSTTEPHATATDEAAAAGPAAARAPTGPAPAAASGATAGGPAVGPTALHGGGPAALGAAPVSARGSDAAAPPGAPAAARGGAPAPASTRSVPQGGRAAVRGGATAPPAVRAASAAPAAVRQPAAPARAGSRSGPLSAAALSAAQRQTRVPSSGGRAVEDPAAAVVAAAARALQAAAAPASGGRVEAATPSNRATPVAGPAPSSRRSGRPAGPNPASVLGAGAGGHTEDVEVGGRRSRAARADSRGAKAQRTKERSFASQRPPAAIDDLVGATARVARARRAAGEREGGERGGESEGEGTP